MIIDILILFYLDPERNGSISSFNINTENGGPIANHSSLPTNTTNAISTVDNLLDLSVENYNQIQNYFPHNGTLSNEGGRLLNSAEHINNFESNKQEDLLDLFSDSEIPDITLDKTSFFYSVIYLNVGKR